MSLSVLREATSLIHTVMLGIPESGRLYIQHKNYLLPIIHIMGAWSGVVVKALRY